LGRLTGGVRKKLALGQRQAAEIVGGGVIIPLSILKAHP
jgi:hypothetical protein